MKSSVGTAPRYNPGVVQEHKWENAMTLDRESWGHRRNMRLEDVLDMQELVETLVITIRWNHLTAKTSIIDNHKAATSSRPPHGSQ